MRVPLLELKSQYESIKSEIDESIQDVLTEGRFIGGSIVTEFEKEFAKKSKISHCVSTANGTDALYIALRALGVGEGDEVITTAVSWLSTASTILQVGATPVFVDIDSTGLLDVTILESKLTKKTKVIIPVHLHGQMIDMKAIRKVCDKHNLLCIEDSAQSHFASRDSVMPGQLADIATFSFYPTKNLGAYGDAGCIVTNNELFADKCRSIANYGNCGEDEKFGINSRMDTMQAAILNVKLRYIVGWTVERRKKAGKYNALLRKVGQVVTPDLMEFKEHTFYTYTIRCERRDELQHYLKNKAIDTAIHYPTILPLLPLFKFLGYQESDFPVATKYQNETLSLPIYAELSDDKIDYVVRCISDFYN